MYLAIFSPKGMSVSLSKLQASLFHVNKALLELFFAIRVNCKVIQKDVIVLELLLF